MPNKSFVVMFLFAFILSASMLVGQRMSSDPVDNVVAMTLSPAPDGAGVVVSAVQTAQCVPFYTATLELSEFADGRWNIVDTIRANIGSMRSIEINGQVLPGRKDFRFGNVRLGPMGRVFRLGISSASVLSENGCVVGTKSRPYTHIELAYFIWGQPPEWPNDLYLGPAATLALSGDKALEFRVLNAKNSTRLILSQDAGWDFVRAKTRVIETGASGFSLDIEDFRQGTPVRMYAVDLVTGESFSVTMGLPQSFGRAKQ